MKKLLFLLSFYFFCATAFSQQELKLWYNKPAAKWTEALPIGNGRLGAMIFGDVEKEHLQFNEETLWTGGPRDYNRKGAYQYLPQLRQLLFDGKQKEAEALGEEHFMALKSIKRLVMNFCLFTKILLLQLNVTYYANSPCLQPKTLRIKLLHVQS